MLKLYKCVHILNAYVCSLYIAIYPKAATNLLSCFGEEVGFNASEKFIINLQWQLPEGK